MAILHSTSFGATAHDILLKVMGFEIKSPPFMHFTFNCSQDLEIERSEMHERGLTVLRNLRLKSPLFIDSP